MTWKTDPNPSSLARGLLVAALAGLAGCAGVQRCPGVADVGQALGRLRVRAEAVIPLMAYGKCRLGYPDEQGRPRESTSINVKLWLDPPSNFYIQGFAGMGAQGKVEMGSNAEVFWVGVKPELDRIWWGAWQQAAWRPDVQVDPRVVMEALGILEHLDDEENWSLRKHTRWDVLTQRGERDVPLRRVFLDRCTHVPVRLEYYDDQGPPVVVVELARYRPVSAEVSFPTEIAVSTLENGRGTYWVRLSLSDMRPKTFSDALRRRLFDFDESRLRGYGQVTEVAASSGVDP